MVNRNFQRFVYINNQLSFSIFHNILIYCKLCRKLAIIEVLIILHNDNAVTLGLVYRTASDSVFRVIGLSLFLLDKLDC
jgi:hypothetical protein